MSFSDELAGRVRARMSHLGGLTERPVMSGLGFFLDDRMAVVILDDRLCLRIPDGDKGDFDRMSARPFEFAGRPVRGWVCIPEASLDEASLSGWVARGVSGVGSAM
ncbi:MAG TPA: TfoX/Sxy family protein [Acidimicrobiia bacterium]|nr:TfoX/Sxy family protein [Acidimicrobiia bacterium]